MFFQTLYLGILLCDQIIHPWLNYNFLVLNDLNDSNDANRLHLLILIIMILLPGHYRMI